MRIITDMKARADIDLIILGWTEFPLLFYVESSPVQFLETIGDQVSALIEKIIQDGGESDIPFGDTAISLAAILSPLWWRFCPKTSIRMSVCFFMLSTSASGQVAMDENDRLSSAKSSRLLSFLIVVFRRPSPTRTILHSSGGYGLLLMLCWTLYLRSSVKTAFGFPLFQAALQDLDVVPAGHAQGKAGLGGQ